MDVDAVILAAGYSSRAEGFKMQFQLKNKALLNHVIEAFLPTCKNVIVVGGYQYEKLYPLIKDYKGQVKLVINEEFNQGMFSSVKKGVKEVNAKRFFLTPGDCAMITNDICKTLLESKREYVIPSFQHKAGHPILLPSSCIGELLKEENKSNLKQFLNKKPMCYVEVKEDAILYDLDTKEDYRILKKKMEDKRGRV